ncbi:fibronectin type III domain-containing protein [Candidatus Woesearchaeota archaeon]|nr:fibronectin type III domain-containing protein [Candidatus Woesearchaeota archaeon]
MKQKKCTVDSEQSTVTSGQSAVGGMQYAVCGTQRVGDGRPEVGTLQNVSRALCQTWTLIALLIAQLVITLPAAQAVVITHDANPASQITDNGARVFWVTDLPATTRVDYGTTKELGAVVEGFNLTKIHDVRIENLTPQTLYYLQLVSIALGDARIDDNQGKFYSFITRSSSQRRLPSLTNISIVELADDTTTIAWNTDVPATTVIYFGTPDIVDVREDSELTTRHEAVLTTTAGASYKFIAASCNAEACRNSTVQGFVAGTGIAPNLTADIPRYAKADRIDVRGTSKPFSKLTLSVNGAKQRALDVEGDGSFTFIGVHLPQNENELLLEAVDQSAASSQATYKVTIDAVPPKLLLTPIPKFAKEPALLLKGNVSEAAKITWTVSSAKDAAAPQKVKGLSTKDVTETSVTFSWEPSNATDLREYAIYRDGKRIATSTAAEFIDTLISNKTYRYRVSAVDASCNEGALSESLVVATKPGGFGSETLTDAINITCEALEDAIDVEAGPVELSVQLQEGKNTVRITATDAAGNKAVMENMTTLDTSPPVFLENNLDRLSPSYSDSVRITAKLSEPAIVLVFINNDTKPVAVEATDADGNFDKRIQLRREIKKSGAEKRVTLAIEDAYVNNIRLEAIDASGQKAVEGPVEILYARCGTAGPFSITFSKPQPDILTPRLILEGFQQIGFNMNLTYRGGYNATVLHANVAPIQLSGEDDKKYDHSWVTVNPTMFQGSNKLLSYIQVNFQSIDPLPEQQNATYFQREQALSEHRIEECKIPLFGCVKLLLQAEIEYEERIPRRLTAGVPQLTGEDTQPQKGRQRTCVDVEVSIDRRIDPTIIPNSLVEGAVKFLDKIIGAIDTVLEPLITIGTYLLYTCFAMSAWLYMKFVNERWQCDVSRALAIFGDAGFDKGIAEAGLCGVFYPEDKEGVKNAACMKCQTAVQSRMNFENTHHSVCDRVACPSAPTLQYYIKQTEPASEIEIPDTRMLPPNYPYVMNVEGRKKLFAGSNCGFYDEAGEGAIDIGYTGGGRQGDVNAKKGIKEIYLDYLKHQGDKEETLTAVSKINCNGLHPATPECCGFEYQKTWGSSCGVPGLLETFDELKESACLAAQQANDVRGLEAAASRAGNTMQCKSLFNSVAGFCEPDTGKPVGDILPTGLQYKERKHPSTWGGNEVYVQIKPAADGKGYRITRGYVVERAVYERLKSGDKNLDASQTEYLNAKLTFYKDGKDLSQFFDAAKHPNAELAKAGFSRALCEDDVTGCPPTTTNQAYDEIRSRIGITDKEYIVRPDQEGILRSIQCVCIPAITSYLKFWKGVLSAVRNCFQSLQLTGDGNAGLCQAVLSQYMCDLLYDLISCFTQKYSNPGLGRRVGTGGIGDVIGALTGAGSDMSRSISSRYGKTALYKTMFIDRKLLHSVCMFAFTGTWNLDVRGLFEQTVEDIPIKSQAVLYPCTRRFTSFNPVTSPAGLTSWVYHIGAGLAAGADLNFYLELKCSNSLRCQPRDGFKDGRCDCFSKQERTIQIPLGSGQLKKGEIFGTGAEGEIFQPIQAGGDESYVRYDKAVLRWEYTDAAGQLITEKQDCDVGLVGGDAPAFCQFEPYTATFRCDVGIGQFAGIRFNAEPTPVYPQGIDAYRLGDPVQFRLDMQQQFPAKRECVANCEYTKFLTYKLKNQHGDVIADSGTGEGLDVRPTPIALNTNGQILRTDLPGTVVARPFFGRKAAQILPGTIVKPEGDANMVLSAAAAPNTGPQKFVVVFLKNGYEIYETTGNFNANGGYVQGDRKAGTLANPAGWGYYQKGAVLDSKIGQTPNVFSYGGITMTVSDAIYVPLRINNIDTAREVFINYQAILTPESAVCDPNKPTEWKLQFTVFDASKLAGGGYFYDPNQISTDPSTKNPVQTREIPFNVVCSETYKGAQQGIPAGLQRCFQPSFQPLQAPCFCGSEAQWQETITKFPSLTPEQQSKVHNCPSDATNIYCVKDTCGPIAACVPNQAARSECLCGPSYASKCAVGKFCVNDKCEDQPVSGQPVTQPTGDRFTITDATQPQIALNPEGTVYGLTRHSTYFLNLFTEAETDASAIKITRNPETLFLGFKDISPASKSKAHLYTFAVPGDSQLNAQGTIRIDGLEKAINVDVKVAR